MRRIINRDIRCVLMSNYMLEQAKEFDRYFVVKTDLSAGSE